MGIHRAIADVLIERNMVEKKHLNSLIIRSILPFKQFVRLGQVITIVQFRKVWDSRGMMSKKGIMRQLRSSLSRN